MNSRLFAAKELAGIFKILAHFDRIRIIEVLKIKEIDVSSLSMALNIPATRISQHLALLRAHKIVKERRNGRHVYYQLTQPDLAHWIVDGLQFVEARAAAEHINTLILEEERKRRTDETD